MPWTCGESVLVVLQGSDALELVREGTHPGGFCVCAGNALSLLEKMSGAATQRRADALFTNRVCAMESAQLRTVRGGTRLLNTVPGQACGHVAEAKRMSAMNNTADVGFACVDVGGRLQISLLIWGAVHTEKH